MVRRTFWLLVGAGIGAWMVLKAQEVASRLTPKGAAEAARRHVRHLTNDLGAAVAEGRRAKRATEQDLRHAAHSRPAIDVTARAGLPQPAAAEELPARR